MLGESPFVAPNGTGGAFVAWIASNAHDVRVQQIAANGSTLWAAGGAIVPDGSSSEREAALISDGAGGVFLSFTTATSLRGQRLDRNGTAQWKTGTSNGLGLGPGELSMIGVGNAGPLVLYKRGTGLFAKAITVAAPFQLTNIVALANSQVSLSLTGGAPGQSYDIVRAGSLVPLSNNAWTVVGVIQPGQTWTDTNPVKPRAFYAARAR